MQDSFEKAFSTIVNDTLNEIFTETATQLIYQHLEQKYQLKPENIATNLPQFKEGLEKFLTSGALVVEDIVIKRVYRHFNQKLENKQGYTFTDYMKELERKLKKP